MRVFLVALMLSVAVSAQEINAAPSKTSISPLENKDVLLMHSAGLSDEVISEKIRTSACHFETTPTALADLKREGVTDALVLEIIRCESRSNQKDESSPSDSSHADAIPRSSTAYTIAFVNSDRKWRYGFRSEPYNKISDYLETKLVDGLGQHGLQRSPAPDGNCYLLTIELLEVTSHPAAIKKPGVDVTANLAVTDSNHRMLYSKGYRGESRTLMDTWGHLINHAIEAMVQTMTDDENLTRTLSTGKP